MPTQGSIIKNSNQVTDANQQAWSQIWSVNYLPTQNLYTRYISFPGRANIQIHSQFYLNGPGSKTICYFNDRPGESINCASQVSWYGVMNSSSSKRYKTNIQPINNIHDKFMKLKPISFQYKNDSNNETHFGFLYEDIVKLFPTVCDTEKHTIEYAQFIPLLLKEIQDLQKRVNELKKKKKQLTNS